MGRGWEGSEGERERESGRDRQIDREQERERGDTETHCVRHILLSFAEATGHGSVGPGGRISSHPQHRAEY